MTALDELSCQEISLEARSSTPFDPGPRGISAQLPDQLIRGSARSLRSSSRSTKRTRLVPTVIIDKSPLFRAGLTHVLAGDRFRIATGCSALCDLPESALNNGQCLVLIGLDNGAVGPILSQIASLKGEGRALRIIVFTDQFRSEELLAAIEAGADGYLIKSEITPQALVQSLELVLLGGVVIPRGLSRMLGGRVQLLDAVPAMTHVVSECAQPQHANSETQSADLARLSNREQMTLMELTQGASNKLIARKLNITESTVKVHIKSLLRKIRVNNRTQAAMWAIDRFRKASE